MPLATINVLSGHPKPTLKKLLREFTAKYAQILEAPIDRLQVWIEEIDPELYAVAGQPADEALAQNERPAVEIPLIRMAIMAGRPESQVEDAIRELSEVVARNLGTQPERVRAEVRSVAPERWGIGGKLASVLRATDIAARKTK